MTLILEYMYDTDIIYKYLHSCSFFILINIKFFYVVYFHVRLRYIYIYTKIFIGKLEKIKYKKFYLIIKVRDYYL